MKNVFFVRVTDVKYALVTFNFKNYNAKAVLLEWAISKIKLVIFASIIVRFAPLNSPAKNALLASTFIDQGLLLNAGGILTITDQ